MKSVLSLAILFFAANLHAEVKPPGTIMKTQCADAKEANPRIGGYSINEVCVGRIVGSRGSVLVVTESRVLRGGSSEQTTIWEIKEKAASWKVTEIGYRDESGRFQEKAAASFVTGKIKVKRGRGTTLFSKMEGDLGGREFIATDFRTIFHTM